MKISTYFFNVFARIGEDSPYENKKIFKKQRINALFFETFDVLVGDPLWELFSINNHGQHIGILDYLFPTQLLAKFLLKGSSFQGEKSYYESKELAYDLFGGILTYFILMLLWFVLQAIQYLIGFVLAALVTLVGAVVILAQGDLRTTLPVLNFQDDEIGDVGVESLVEALKKNRVIRELNLKGNKIGDVGAKTLARVIRDNTTLTTLNLANNEIGDAGAKELAQALKDNRTLTTLILDNNAIRDAGAKELAQALKDNRTLTTLNLNNNRISEAGVKELAQALKDNHTLTTLGLVDSEICGDNDVLNILQQNYALTEFLYDRRSYIDKNRESYVELLNRNKRIGVRELNIFLEESSIDNKVLSDISKRLRKLVDFIREEKLPLTHYLDKLYRLCSAVLSLHQAVSSESSAIDEREYYEDALRLLLQPFHDPELRGKARDRLKDCLVQLIRLTADSTDQNEKDKHTAYARLLAYHLRYNRQDLAFGIAMNAFNPKIDIAPSLEKFMTFDDLVVIARKVLKALKEKRETVSFSSCYLVLIKEISLLRVIVNQQDYHHAEVTALFSLPSFVKELHAENIKALYLLEECLEDSSIDPRREDTRNYVLSFDQTPGVLFEYLVGVRNQYFVEKAKPDHFKEILAEATRASLRGACFYYEGASTSDTASFSRENVSPLPTAAGAAERSKPIQTEIEAQRAQDRCPMMIEQAPCVLSSSGSGLGLFASSSSVRANPSSQQFSSSQTASSSSSMVSQM